MYLLADTCAQGENQAHSFAYQYQAGLYNELFPERLGKDILPSIIFSLFLGGAVIFFA